LEQALDWIVQWHKAAVSGENARTVTLSQIAAYRTLAGATSPRAAA